MTETIEIIVKRTTPGVRDGETKIYSKVHLIRMTDELRNGREALAYLLVDVVTQARRELDAANQIKAEPKGKLP